MVRVVRIHPRLELGPQRPAQIALVHLIDRDDAAHQAVHRLHGSSQELKDRGHGGFQRRLGPAQAEECGEGDAGQEQGRQGGGAEHPSHQNLALNRL
jgi:hypothetical protein